MLKFEMENLLCDEVLFDTSPKIECGEEDGMQVANGDSGRKLMLLVHDQTTEEEFARDLGVILEKEASYMPQSGYVDHVNSNAFLRKERKKAMCWLIKSQRRLGLSLGTLFNAANYLDRFISNNKCQGWKTWMFQLLSITCMSVAAKFNETSTPPLREFQADDELGHYYFEWRIIQRMELTLLKTIGYRLTPTTPFSYVEMLTWSLRSLNSYFSDEFINRVTDLLLESLLDCTYLEFQPFVIAMSAIEIIASEELISKNCNVRLQHFYCSFNTQDYQQKEKLILKCQEMMRKKQPIEDQSLLDYYYCNHNYTYGGDTGGSSPSSPVTVLLTATVDHCNTCCCGSPDLTIKRMTQIISEGFSPSKRMKKEEHAA